jgi:hypothetical protein
MLKKPLVLKLNRETVRTLTNAEAGEVHAGQLPPTVNCGAQTQNGCTASQHCTDGCNYDTWWSPN